MVVTRGDRRGSVRFEVIGHLWGTLELEEPVPVVDIGASGAALSTAAPLAPDSRHVLQLSVAGEVVSVDARVRHARPQSSASPRYVVGVEFLDLPGVVAASIGHDETDQ
jgi:hypothetical protein